MGETPMSGIPLAQAQAQLKAWLEASLAVSTSQSYSIQTDSSSRTLTRAHAVEIQKQVAFWDAQVKRLSRGGLTIRRLCLNED